MCKWFIEKILCDDVHHGFLHIIGRFDRQDIGFESVPGDDLIDKFLCQIDVGGFALFACLFIGTQRNSLRTDLFQCYLDSAGVSLLKIHAGFFKAVRVDIGDIIRINIQLDVECFKRGQCDSECR